MVIISVERHDEAPHQGKDIGVIAQEIENTRNSIRKRHRYMLNHQKLTALLIEAVKELKER